MGLRHWEAYLSPYGQTILNLVTLGSASGLPLQAGDKQRYIAALREMDRTNPEKFVFEHLNQNLDILDVKSNSTILLTSILTVVCIAAIDHFKDVYLPIRPWTENALPWILRTGAGASSLALLLLISVHTLYWPSITEIQNKDVRTERLLNIRNWRTIRYRAAWRVTVLSLCILSIAVIYALIFPFLSEGI